MLKLHFVEDEICKRLQRLNPHKACGVDEVNPMVLKSCANAFAKPLTIIFRKSLDEGRVPFKWKLANITPILKKGSRVLAANYRPVSLTSIVCKVMEGLIRDCFMEYLEAEKLITDRQHGFVRRKSCATNLLESLDYLTDMLSKGIPVDVI